MVTDHDLDPFIAKIAGELKEPVRLDARFDERVMSALEPEVISLASRRVVQPWYRRSLSVPAPLGLAVAAALAGIAAIGVLTLRDGTEGAQVVSAPPIEAVAVNDASVDPDTQFRSVMFLFTDSSAASASLIGAFNDWKADSTPMAYDAAHGAWSVTVQLLPGTYEYQFLLDGTRHATDPTAPMVTSDFSSPNSVIVVRAR